MMMAIPSPVLLAPNDFYEDASIDFHMPYIPSPVISNHVPIVLLLQRHDFSRHRPHKMYTHPPYDTFSWTMASSCIYHARAAIRQSRTQVDWDAINNLGVFLVLGINGMPRDDIRAMALFRRAAGVGRNMTAAANLVVCHISGLVDGTCMTDRVGRVEWARSFFLQLMDATSSSSSHDAASRTVHNCATYNAATLTRNRQECMGLLIHVLAIDPEYIIERRDVCYDEYYSEIEYSIQKRAHKMDPHLCTFAPIVHAWFFLSRFCQTWGEISDPDSVRGHRLTSQDLTDIHYRQEVFFDKCIDIAEERGDTDAHADKMRTISICPSSVHSDALEHLLRMHAKQGSPNAQHVLAMFYINAYDKCHDKRDPRQYLLNAYIQLIASAHHGFLPSQVMLADADCDFLRKCIAATYLTRRQVDMQINLWLARIIDCGNTDKPMEMSIKNPRSRMAAHMLCGRFGSVLPNEPALAKLLCT